MTQGVDASLVVFREYAGEEKMRRKDLNPTSRGTWRAAGRLTTTLFLIKAPKNVFAVHTSININIICCHNIFAPWKKFWLLHYCNAHKRKQKFVFTWILIHK